MGKAQSETVHQMLARKKPSYNYCGICSRVPEDSLAEPNYAPIRWWDPDDGWKIGTLCRTCAEMFYNRRPQPEDFAYDEKRDHVCDHENTDEDAQEAL